jgi:branched-chain amino acid aminotransferase
VPERINVNGRVTEPGLAVISPLDRGFLYGDSVYETIRAHAGRPFRLGAHLERLRLSAGRLDIPLERLPLDPEREVLRTLQDAAIAEAAIRVVLSRGPGPIGYDPEGAGPPTLVVHVRAAPVLPRSAYAEGVDVAIVGVARNAPEAVDPAIKSSNLLNNFLAWREARRLGAFEAILPNSGGHLAEGSSSNLFVVREGRLLTPPPEDGILLGITRGLVLELARAAALPAAEQPLAPDDLRRADEAFLTSTLKGVLPIRRCDGWPIREGRPGPVTRSLMERFEALVQAETNAGSDPGSSRR